ncbi:MAG: hypothetical protein Q7S79_04220 [bacterium]|nr:hypothetical protein [bacterium]
MSKPFKDFLFNVAGIVTICFIASFFIINIPDNVAVRLLIPRYPNSSNTIISSDGGYPDSYPRASIVFYTKDSADQVFDFYTKELTKNDWSISNKQVTGGSGTYTDQTIEGNRKLYGVNFHISIHKGFYDSIKGEKESDEVTIFFKR